MKLISCCECAVVLNQDIAIPSNENEFNEKYYDEDFTIKSEISHWDGDGFVACVICPVCGELIETDRRL